MSSLPIQAGSLRRKRCLVSRRPDCVPPSGLFHRRCSLVALYPGDDAAQRAETSFRSAPRLTERGGSHVVPPQGDRLGSGRGIAGEAGRRRSARGPAARGRRAGRYLEHGTPTGLERHGDGFRPLRARASRSVVLRAALGPAAVPAPRTRRSLRARSNDHAAVGDAGPATATANASPTHCTRWRAAGGYTGGGRSGRVLAQSGRGRLGGHDPARGPGPRRGEAAKGIARRQNPRDGDVNTRRWRPLGPCALSRRRELTIARGQRLSGSPVRSGSP